ncbi:MAG: DJ-1/PfpI family protein [Hyphomicrobiaceae bacterium]|nr:DJ-1/PfpI family protein [Hyphomicrobiaceae bacterium]
MTEIAIIAFDGVTDIDVWLHWDFLNRPLTMFPEMLPPADEPPEEEETDEDGEGGGEDEAVDYEAQPTRGGNWSVMILGTKPQHVTAAGYELRTHGPIESARDMDAVVVASGPATRELMNDAEFLARLLLDPDDQYVCSQCSGALILAGSGLLAGVEATTYPTAREALESKGGIFVEKPLVTHERMAMAAGCLAGVELDRWLLTQLIDKETADKCIESGLGWGQGIERVYA